MGCAPDSAGPAPNKFIFDPHASIFDPPVFPDAIREGPMDILCVLPDKRLSRTSVLSGAGQISRITKSSTRTLHDTIRRAALRDEEFPNRLPFIPNVRRFIVKKIFNQPLALDCAVFPLVSAILKRRTRIRCTQNPA